MTIDRKLGKRCKYATTCPLFHGIGIPENMTQPLWRNVFCYRGIKGWTNCEKFKALEEAQTSH
jgi:hypothetical protein